MQNKYVQGENDKKNLDPLLRTEKKQDYLNKPKDKYLLFVAY